MAIAGLAIGALQTLSRWSQRLLPDRYLGPDTGAVYADLGFRPPADGAPRLTA